MNPPGKDDPEVATDPPGPGGPEVDDQQTDDEPDGAATDDGGGQEGPDAGASPPVHTALARLAQARPVQPPRRTGIFLDADDLREHVGALLRTVLGGYEVDAFGNFSFTYESARVVVTVGNSPIGPQVGVFSVTNLDVDLTPELATFLLTTNHTLGFGSFSFDPANRAVWLRHSLLGTTLDLPELHSAVAAIATTAARLDHPIAERFGGRTFVEAPRAEQDRMEPPEPSQDEGPRPGVTGYL